MFADSQGASVPDRVPVHHMRLPAGMHAATDGREVYIESRLLQVERRCALAHELVHIEWGHGECQPFWTEARVRRATAEHLIDWDRLVDAFRWTDSIHEAADELEVTPVVLEDRLRWLSPDEGMALWGASRRDWA